MYSWIEDHLNFMRYAPAIFFISIVCCMYIGWLYGCYRIKKSDNIVIHDAFATAILGLSALVLGFTFSNAISHFDRRIDLIRQQGDAIIQVHQASKYLNAQERQDVNKQLEHILETRLAFYVDIENMEELNRRLADLDGQLNALNELVITAINRAPGNTRDLADQILRPQQVNLMNVFRSSLLNAKNHTPVTVERFLFILLSVGAFLSGYSMAIQKEEDGFLAMVYVMLVGITIYIIFALEYPYQFQNLDYLNAELIRAQKMIK